MKIGDIMRIDIVTIPHTYTYEDTAKHLHQHNIIGAPIVNEEGKLISMITQKDLLRVLYPYAKSFYENPILYSDLEKREQKILEIKKDPITKFAPSSHISANIDDPILRVGGKMLARGIQVIPVVDTSGNLLGVVFRDDIYKKIASEYLEI